MSRSLEARRIAVVEALRDLEREAARDSGRARRLRADPRSTRLAALEHRVAALDARLGDVSGRLASVETTLLESAWEQPQPVGQPAAAAGDGEADEDADDDEGPRPAVPPVTDVSGSARMSAVAARALFGD